MSDESPSRIACHALEDAYQREELEDFAGALEACDQAIEAAPTWHLAHNLRGLILEEMERPAEAVIAYREALKLAPNFAAARKNLRGLEIDWARSYLDQILIRVDSGEIEGALSACRAALVIAPDLAALHNLHGVLLDELEQTEAALEAYHEALQYDPNLKNAHENKQRATRRLTVLPQLEEAYRLEEKGHLEAALKACDRALNVVPDLAEAHHLRGLLLEEMEQPQKALEAYNKAILLDPHLPNIHADRVNGVKVKIQAIDGGPRLHRFQSHGDLSDSGEAETETSELDSHLPTCPQCNSPHLTPPPYYPPSVSAWLLLGLPPPYSLERWRCEDCGYSWKIKSD